MQSHAVEVSPWGSEATTGTLSPDSRLVSPARVAQLQAPAGMRPQQAAMPPSGLAPLPRIGARDAEAAPAEADPGKASASSEEASAEAGATAASATLEEAAAALQAKERTASPAVSTDAPTAIAECTKSREGEAETGPLGSLATDVQAAGTPAKSAYDVAAAPSGAATSKAAPMGSSEQDSARQSVQKDAPQTSADMSAAITAEVSPGRDEQQKPPAAFWKSMAGLFRASSPQVPAGSPRSDTQTGVPAAERHSDSAASAPPAPGDSGPDVLSTAQTQPEAPYAEDLPSQAESELPLQEAPAPSSPVHTAAPSPATEPAPQPEAAKSAAESSEAEPGLSVKATGSPGQVLGFSEAEEVVSPERMGRSRPPALITSPFAVAALQAHCSGSDPRTAQAIEAAILLPEAGRFAGQPGRRPGPGGRIEGQLGAASALDALAQGGLPSLGSPTSPTPIGPGRQAQSLRPLAGGAHLPRGALSVHTAFPCFVNPPLSVKSVGLSCNLLRHEQTAVYLERVSKASRMSRCGVRQVGVPTGPPSSPATAETAVATLKESRFKVELQKGLEACKAELSAKSAQAEGPSTNASAQGSPTPMLDSFEGDVHLAADLLSSKPPILAAPPVAAQTPVTGEHPQRSMP